MIKRLTIRIDQRESYQYAFKKYRLESPHVPHIWQHWSPSFAKFSSCYTSNFFLFFFNKWMEYSIFSSNLVMFSCTVSYHLSNNGKIFSFFFSWAVIPRAALYLSVLCTFSQISSGRKANQTYTKMDLQKNKEHPVTAMLSNHYLLFFLRGIHGKNCLNRKQNHKSDTLHAIRFPWFS